MTPPNTLTFALLGLIAERPRSAYELANQIQTSVVRGVWPSATSHTYAQIKQLAALGFATVAQQSLGARKRSVYKVTALGRKALRDWLTEPESKSLAFESERLLKFLFCGTANIEDRDLLGGIEDEVEGTLRATLAMIDNLLNSDGEVVAAHRKGAVINLLIDFRETYVAWSRDQLESRADKNVSDNDLSEYRRAKKRLEKILEK